MRISRHFTLLGTALVSVFCASCAGYQAAYTIPLKNVRAVAGANDIHALAMSNPAQAAKLDAADDIEHFRHEAFGLTAHLTPHDIQITLTNTSSEPITLDWKNGVYVDENGKEFGIVRSDVHPRFTDQMQPVSIVQPGQTIIERCYPTKCIVQFGRSFSVYPLLPSGALGNGDALNTQLHTLIGKELRLLLPLRVGAKEYSVSMEFVIRHAAILPQ
ncbi:MAG: hypothetical protein MUF71_01060 [Candidatus Kapabacteria bacterium]|jgi:hypothetical protein|nr:hypothetical protein [Candidatus Kapabacteria bacterium]